MLGKIGFACFCLLVAVALSEDVHEEDAGQDSMYHQEVESNHQLPTARFFGIKLTQTKINIITK